MRVFQSFTGLRGSVLAGAAAVAVAASLSSAATTVVPTVSAYAPGVTGGPAVVNAAAYTGQVLYSQFVTDISTAFTNNRGGTVNFDTGFAAGANAGANVGTGPSNPVAAKFGNSQANTFNFYRTDLDIVAATGMPGNSAGDNSGYFALNQNTNNGVNVTSGNGYLGIQGSVNPNGTFTNIGFGSALSEVGLTFVPRGATRTVTMTAFLDNGTTIVSSTNTTTNTADGAIFYGFAAPTGRTITSLRINPNDFARFDDLGFVVAAAIPEPTTLAAVAGLGGLFLRRRRA